MAGSRINQEIDLWQKEWILRACFIQIGELYTDSTFRSFSSLLWYLTTMLDTEALVLPLPITVSPLLVELLQHVLGPLALLSIVRAWIGGLR